MLLAIVVLVCYQIPKEILKSTNTNTNMIMWDCISCSGFGIADKRQSDITFQFQITQLFSITD